MAIAPTMSAVEELQKVGFKDAVTIERLLQDPRIQSALRNKVLIVDEAGMVSGRQMQELLNMAEKHSTRVVFSGDTRTDPERGSLRCSAGSGKGVPLKEH